MIKTERLSMTAGWFVACMIASTGWAQDLRVPERALPRGSFNGERQVILPQDRALRSEIPDLPPLEACPRRFNVSQGIVKQSTTLFSEDFEGIFPSNPWSLFTQGLADVTWGKSSFRRSTGTASAWCAKTGSDFPGDGQPVPVNTESWMVAGPFDLSSSSGGNLAFDLWLETESGFDFFGVGASLDGSNFTVFFRDQDTSGWEQFSQGLNAWGSLGDVTGLSQVWFAFLYDSDFSITFEGGYVDNVSLNVETGAGLNLAINQVDPGNCPTVQAIATVTDNQGNPVSGLTESNFTLNEDGAPQSITVATAGSGGSAVAVTLVLDGSGSLSSTDVSNVRSASNAFVDLLGANDQVAVYHFGTSVTLVQDFTTDKDAAKAAVNTLTNNLGATSLYDAIAEAAQHSTVVSGRRALVVMTDGRDNDSANTRSQAIAAAQSAGVPVFTIGFGSVDQIDLQAIADQTSGLFFLGASSADLQTILNLIAQTLNSQYILTWTTAASDGQVHNVEVQVQNQGASDVDTTTYSQAGTACESAGGLNATINQIDAAGCPAVQAICTVTDDLGSPIVGLTEMNFTLEEDGVPQTITVDIAGSTGNALAVTLVLDGSGSLSDADVSNVQNASNAFIDLLGVNDQVAAYHFGTNVTLVQDFTTDKDAAKAAVNSLTNNLGATSLFDAIVEAAQHSTLVSGRRALVVMTDGMNNDSTNTRSQAIAAAQSAGVPVFTIGFGNVNEGDLRAIADQTGGLFFSGATSSDLQTILNRIGLTLNNQYIVSWQTLSRDGQTHDVLIRVQGPSLSDVATSSYSQAGTTCSGLIFADGFESGDTSAW